MPSHGFKFVPGDGLRIVYTCHNGALIGIIVPLTHFSLTRTPTPACTTPSGKSEAVQGEFPGSGANYPFRCFVRVPDTPGEHMRTMHAGGCTAKVSCNLNVGSYLHSTVVSRHSRAREVSWVEQSTRVAMINPKHK